MQENVNAKKVFDSLVEDFGAEKVKMLKDNIIKLKVFYLGYMDYDNIHKLHPIAGIEAKRSDKGIIFMFTANNKVTLPETIPCKTVRDFFELSLDQDARIAAFENTAKIKLDLPANNLAQAILQSFYISETPQGACYWQDIICI